MIGPIVLSPLFLLPLIFLAESRNWRPGMLYSFAILYALLSVVVTRLISTDKDLLAQIIFPPQNSQPPDKPQKRWLQFVTFMAVMTLIMWTTLFIALLICNIYF